MPGRVLIVGASRGIGLGLANEFASRRFDVVATAREVSDSELGRTQPAGVTIEQVDIADADSIAGLASRLGGQSRAAPFDIVMVNAGMMPEQDGASVTEAQLGQAFLTNAVAPIRVARAMLPHLTDGGVIGFTSSLMGSQADNESGGVEIYRASKAALNSMALSFAATEAKSARTLILHPGWVRTAMGGPNAPLSVEDSARGLADVLTADRPAGSYFLDYRGHMIPW